MSEDYEDLLDQNVDEVKKSIRNMEDPDLEKILKMEKGNRDRKTVKEFVQDRIDSGEVEVQEQDMEDLVEDIEEETDGGLLGSFQPTQVLVGGIIAGIVIGLLGGMALSMDSGGSKQAVRDSLNSLFDASGTNAEIVSITPESGVYQVRFNRTRSSPFTNQTQEVTSTLFMSQDGKYIFRGSTVQQQINALERLQRRRQQARNRTGTDAQRNTTVNQSQ